MAAEAKAREEALAAQAAAEAKAKEDAQFAKGKARYRKPPKQKRKPPNSGGKRLMRRACKVVNTPKRQILNGLCPKQMIR